MFAILTKPRLTSHMVAKVNVAKSEAPLGYYVITVSCDNCDNPMILTIPQGVYIVDYATITDCINCGCKLVEIIDEELACFKE